LDIHYKLSIAAQKIEGKPGPKKKSLEEKNRKVKMIKNLNFLNNLTTILLHLPNTGCGRLFRRST
jgi:hypothetical protein